MSSPLFRPQVFAAQQAARFGDAVFYQPLSVRFMVLFLIAVFVSFLVFAGSTHIRQTERVRGYLTSAGGEVKVYGSRPGILSEILVADGDVVAAGGIIAMVTDPRSDHQGLQAAGVALQQIDAQLQQLARRRSVLEARVEAQSTQLRRQLTGMQSALSLLRQENEILRHRVTLADHDYQASRHLKLSKTISEREHRQSVSALYQLQQQEKTGALAIEKHLQAMAEVEQQLLMHPLLAEEDLLLLDSAVSQLLARRHELQTEHRYTITATRDGIVSNLVLRSGDVVDPREPVLTLLNTDDELQAWLYLPSSALTNVSHGLEVMIRYDAYPYQTYGSFPAQVVSVADSAMDPREFLFPVDVREPVYLVRARITDQSPGSDGVKRFRPGMQFSADIITGRQTVLQTLLSPLNALGERL